MKIKILQWNVNGFHTRYEFLQKILKDDNYDILCIQETNFKNKYHFNIKGYQCFYKTDWFVQMPVAVLRSMFITRSNVVNAPLQVT